MPDALFWRHLGLEWASCDNIATHTRDLHGLLTDRFQASGFPILEAMTAEDRRHYDALPDRVPIFRGCYAHNKSGLSWSTAREVATKFPFQNRYRAKGPT